MLDEYRRKRDPSRTPEPFGAADAAPGRPRFVVQRHSARRLHYDLRLERDGVLASWAVPKGLPLDRGSRRRAIHTEDHPLEYLGFHGVIPKGEYGAGVMDVYDTGTYELLEESKSGSLTVRLRGRRLQGEWTLVPAHLEGDERNWLLVRRDGAEPEPRTHLLQQPIVADALPGGQRLYEVLWPGERLLVRLHEGEPTLLTEQGEDVTQRHSGIANRLGRALRTFDCVVDAQVTRHNGGELLVVSDILELEREPVVDRPLVARRALLAELLDPVETSVRLADVFDDGEALLAAAHEGGLRGVVGRRPRSRYRPGAAHEDWVAVLLEAPADRTVELRTGRRVVSLTRLDYLWWPETGVRKRDLVDYYRAVAPALLPHLRNRPFTLKRYLNGPNAPFEWVKDAPPELPEWIARCPLPAKSRRGEIVDYPLVNDELALAWMVDYGCIDLHLWFSRCDKPSRPDYVLFDLDPAQVEMAQVVDAALLLREALEALGLVSFVRTSGGDGLHVQVPVARRYTYEQTRRFAEVVADALVRARPDLVTVSRDVRRRRGVFVDTKMNGEGMTIASVYSVRPHPGPPVATPLRWEELTPRLDARTFTMEDVLGRLDRHGDLHADLLRTPQRLEPALARFGG
ncbi:MAG TPA: non-homologous end-joining DNA ligase [Gaiellaceae bacterium]|nr:non-homologous end-joining DNA ligase [Gaiellaceae bacterium]